jgi:hypothetical protein
MLTPTAALALPLPAIHLTTLEGVFSEVRLQVDEHRVGGCRQVYHPAPGASRSLGFQGRKGGHQAGTAHR